ncbi:unnamed protein product [Nesidiocoris tenuis]|uniref:Uncharacterized protein n=1 Tax=Nesidiocoris tenuis TaxID=355587 RepID=A0A6H5HMV5_9HEMI|nr:unnamed protein product [Nesidiocoris tenuis]
MTTPATGERLLKFDRHAARHSRVYGPRPTCQRRDGLRATLITFGKVFQLGPPANDAPEDGRRRPTNYIFRENFPVTIGFDPNTTGLLLITIGLLPIPAGLLQAPAGLLPVPAGLLPSPDGVDPITTGG